MQSSQGGTVLRLDRYRIKLLPRELRNIAMMLRTRLLRRLHRTLTRADVAYMYIEHPVILPFILDIRRHLGVNIHLVSAGEDFSAYRKVIVPNGLWPEVRAATQSLAQGQPLYCEIGFLPQTRNVYFDPLGVHGHSSIRHLQLTPLAPHEKESLEHFRRSYISRDYVRVKWDSLDLAGSSSKSGESAYNFEFYFVPLQLTRDTAFALCPFENNQAVIDFVERTLPDKRIIFKPHPLDENAHYRVRAGNILLPPENKDLRQLLTRCRAVVAANSTVILEALVLRKPCATYGIGFTTNHHVTLECHEKLPKLAAIDTWQPDANRVDSFLWLLLSRQVARDFAHRPLEKEKLASILAEYNVLPTPVCEATASSLQQSSGSKDAA